MAQELAWISTNFVIVFLLNEVPEHMAQESGVTLNNGDTNTILNEVPEHMAQELPVAEEPVELVDSSMKFLSTWLRNRVAVTIDPYDYIPQ